MLTTGRLGKKHLTLGKQVAMIEGHGTAVVVSPCMQCPCLTAEQQFSPLCPACKGTGRFYPSGISYATTLLLVGEDSRRTFQEPGSWTSGMIRASVLPGVRLAERDKVRLVDITDVFSDEVLFKGVDDQVRFSSGVTVLLIADVTTIYRPMLDYLLMPPNTIAWVAGGKAPAFGTQYAVRYQAYPEYLVVNDAPRLRIEHRIPQSSEVILMRLDKLGQEGL
jgi:hypothetical protein